MTTKIDFNNMYIHHYPGEKIGLVQGPILPFKQSKDYDPERFMYNDNYRMGNITFHTLDEKQKLVDELNIEITSHSNSTVPEEFLRLYEDYKKGHKIKITIETVEEKFPEIYNFEEQIKPNMIINT